MSTQFNSCMKFNHMCVHVQEINIEQSLNKSIKKMFKVQLQSNQVEKISKKFQSPVQVNCKTKKFSKNQVSEKISKFQMPG